MENVPAVTRDRRRVVSTSIDILRGLGYGVASRAVDISKLGLPQTRRRHLLLAIRGTPHAHDQIAEGLFEEACAPVSCIPRTVRWAIEDLEHVGTQGPLDVPSLASPVNKERIAWLLDNDEYDLPNRLRPPCHRNGHTYKSMYGRLHWDLPAQTITTGFTCTGQGRYVHPSRPRTLTPHEAARLQGFPDFFDFASATGRSAHARLIGNAVPPALVGAIISALLRQKHLGRGYPSRKKPRARSRKRTTGISLAR